MLCVFATATCLSVRLFVTASIVTKRKQLASWFLHHLIAPWFHSLARYDSSKNSQRVTPSEGELWVGWVRTGDFSTYKPPYLQNGARYDQDYYWTLIGNRISAFDWYQNQRPWMTLNGHYAFFTLHVCVSDQTTKIWMTTDPYVSGKNVALSTEVRLMRIFPGIRWRGGIRW